MFKTDKSCFGEIGWSLSGALQTKIEEIWFLSIGAGTRSTSKHKDATDHIACAQRHLFELSASEIDTNELRGPFNGR